MKYLFTITFALAFYSCNNTEKNTDATFNKKDSASEASALPSINTTNISPQEDSILRQDRLNIIGDWIPSDATDNEIVLTFTSDLMLNKGLNDTSSYTLSYVSCEGNDNTDHAEYLSVKDADGEILCYVITGIDDKNLAMIYVSGNGTISTYKRPKTHK